MKDEVILRIPDSLEDSGVNVNLHSGIELEARVRVSSDIIQDDISVIRGIDADSEQLVLDWDSLPALWTFLEIKYKTTIIRDLVENAGVDDRETIEIERTHVFRRGDDTPFIVDLEDLLDLSTGFDVDADLEIIDYRYLQGGKWIVEALATGC